MGPGTTACPQRVSQASDTVAGQPSRRSHFPSSPQEKATLDRGGLFFLPNPKCSETQHAHSQLLLARLESPSPCTCFLHAWAQQGTMLCKTADTPANATMTKTYTCSQANTVGNLPRTCRPTGLHTAAGAHSTATAMLEPELGHPQPTFPTARYLP